MLVHLMLELYGVDPKILSDEPLVRRALDEFPQRIDMEKVSPVHLYQIETSNPLDDRHLLLQAVQPGRGYCLRQRNLSDR